MDALIIFGAKYLIYIVALGAVAVVLVSPHRNRLALLAVVSLAVGYALARVAGLFFSHPQPFAQEGFTPLVPHDIDNSFPSDHMLASSILASVAWIADVRSGLALWILAFLIGFARVAAGLHYLVDILASLLLALFTVWVVRKALQYFGWY